MANPKGGAHASLLKRAVAAHEEGNLLQAELFYSQILEESPGHAAAHNLLGVLKFKRGDVDEAFAHFDSALQVQPSFADAFNSRGNAFRDLGRNDEALRSFESGLKVAPGNSDLLYNRGILLQQFGRHAEAAADLRKALVADPSDPDVLCDLAVSLRAFGEDDEALELLRRALRKKPDHAQALSNSGNALLALGRTAAAIESHHAAVAVDPGNADIRLNLAIAELSAGDWQSGWRNYAWRHGAKQFHGRFRDFSQPLWQGDFALSGRTILLHAEQGFGDTIMFARYAPRVSALGATVILDVQPRLKRLFEGFEGVAQVIASGETLPEFDCQCPLPGLPLAFATTPATVPGGFPYLSATAAAREKWRKRLSGGKALRVGIVWSGSREYAKDRARSSALRDLLPIFAVSGAHFISLQKDVDAEDAALLSSFGVDNTGPEQEDFYDAAGLVAEMDLVISVDTAIAHLAGAMAKNVWLMLAFAPDWRWMRERESSPWYPATRLFRQEKRTEGWTNAVRRIAEALGGLCS